MLFISACLVQPWSGVTTISGERARQAGTPVAPPRVWIPGLMELRRRESGGEMLQNDGMHNRKER
jgi:hypothetical protein